MLKLPSCESAPLKNFLLFFFLLFLFIFYFRPLESEDVWWHLSTGRWMFEHGAVPSVDPFAFAGERTPWLCYHWLGSAVLYGIFDIGGYVGLKVFRSLFLLAVIGLFVFYARKKVPFYVLITLAFLMSLGLSNRVWLRPDFFNYLFLQLFLIILFSYQRQPEARKLLFLPLLGVVWFNLHIGSFIYGLPLILIFLLAAVMRYAGVSLSNGKRAEALRCVKQLGLAFVACWAGFLINPYGIEGFLFPLKTFLFPQHIGFYKISSTIMETQPPVSIFANWNSFYYFLLFLFAVLALKFNKENKFLLTILFVIPLFGFLYMARNVGFFTVATVYVIVEVAASARFYEWWRRWSRAKVIDYMVIAGLTIYFAFGVSELFESKVMFHEKSMPYLSVESNLSYDNLIREMQASGIEGPVFNSDFLGGQTIWLAYPKLRPFEDARFLDLKRFSNARTIWQNPQRLWPWAETAYGFKIVIIGQDSALTRYLNTQPSWQLIAVRGAVVVFVKRGGFHLSEGFGGFEQRLRSERLTSADIEKLKSFASKKKDLPDDGRLFYRYRMIEPLNRALALMGLGYKEAAGKALLEASVTNEPIVFAAADSFLAEMK